MIEEKITLDFWSPCYFSNAGSSNYSSSSTFHLFCLLNFTNNYVFRPLNLLLNCRLHPHCFSFLESKEGTVRWTTPYPLVSMRETPSCSRTAFKFLCTLLHWLVPLWWTPWLRWLWTAGSFAWALRVAVCSTSSIRPSKLPRFMSIDIHRCARQLVLVIGAEGGEQTFWRHGRRVWCCWVCVWCSAPATWCFQGYPIYLL